MSNGPHAQSASSHLITTAIDQLLDTTRKAEDRLEAAGEPAAHDWMFALREVLLDLRRILPRISALSEDSATEATRAALREIAADLLFGFGPHMSHHMQELLASLDNEATNGPGVADQPAGTDPVDDPI
jgi:hypothetical protein